MSKTALIIIYNHQYNKNISKLENIYKDRFSNIYHLVPFYNGDKSNVIPVYDNSFYFQGYVAQGLKSYFQEDYEHYFFIADDLILNPVVNELNYREHLNLQKETSFLPGFITLHENKNYWTRTGEAYHYNIHVPGVEANSQLPDYNSALEAFGRFGLDIKPLSFHQIWKSPEAIAPGVIENIKRRLSQNTQSLPDSVVTEAIKNQLVSQTYNLPYPLVGSYSDIFVVSSDAIKQFCHYCGVFAATKLFVEVALPTSLVFSAKKIVTEDNLKLKGQALWTPEDYKILDKYGKKLRALLEDFPLNHLYLHPIKLSEWAKDYE